MRLRHLPLASVFVANLASAQANSVSAEQLALDATYGVAPQPPRVADAYRRARPLEAPRFRGTLLCEVDVEGEHWDGNAAGGPVQRYMGRVELDVEVGLPNREDVVRFRGPADTNRVAFAIAGVDLGTGDALAFGLADRDVVANDPIGRVAITYGGALPFRGSTEHASLECRGLPESALEAAIDDAITAADAAIARVDAVSRPDRALLSFRPADADPAPALRAVFEIARYTGLADPRFLERRDRIRAEEATFVAARAELVADLEKSAPLVGTGVRLPATSITLVVERVDCAIEDVIGLHSELGLDVPMECAITLNLRNDGAPTTLAWEFHVVDDLGETMPVTRFARRDESGAITRLRTLRLERGDNRLVAAGPTHRALILRIARRRSIAWARLGDGAAREPNPRPGVLSGATSP